MNRLKYYLAIKLWILLCGLTGLVSSCVSDPVPQEDLNRTMRYRDTTAVLVPKKDSIKVVPAKEEYDSIVITLYPNGVRIVSDEYSSYRSVVPKNVSIKLDDWSIKAYSVNEESLLSEKRKNVEVPYKYLDSHTIIVQNHNTFYAIANDHGVSPSILRRYNPHISNIEHLPVGSYIFLNNDHCCN